MLIAQGLDPVKVANQMGHDNAGFTLSRYSHLFDAARNRRGSPDHALQAGGHRFDPGTLHRSLVPEAAGGSPLNHPSFGFDARR